MSLPSARLKWEVDGGKASRVLRMEITRRRDDEVKEKSEATFGAYLSFRELAKAQWCVAQLETSGSNMFRPHQTSRACACNGTRLYFVPGVR